MPKRLRRIAPEVACFLLVTSVYLVHFALAGYGRFYHDAQGYWRLGEQLERGAGFSLFNHDDAYRGYALPLLNYGLQNVASAFGPSDVTIVHIVGALLAATFGVLVVPRLARALFSEARVGWGRVLLLNGLVFLFWRDYLGFPLTDFPALLAASVGLLGLLRATPGGFLAAGLSFALAANLRPAYLPAVAGAVLVAAVLPLGRWRLARRGLAAVLVLGGALAVSLPQMAINQHQGEGWSPTLPAASKLAVGQLRYGLLLQKYETYVGRPEQYPRPEVYYVDPVARRAVEGTDVSEITSYGEYARLVVRHPLAMAGSYALHLFNGLDVRYPTPYVRDLRDSPIVLSLLQYTLVFVAIVRLLLPEARRRLGTIQWVGAGLLVLPSLTAIASAVEPRFFLPVHVLVYMLVCFGRGTGRSLLAGPTARRLSFVGPYIVFLLVCLVLSKATQAQIEHPIGGRDDGPSSPG